MKTAIITGISGQDGAYLSRFLLHKNYRVIGTTRSYSGYDTTGLEYLGILGEIVIEEVDLTDLSSVIRMLNKYQPNEIYNLAAQSSVGLSFEQPIGTFSFNTLSVINLLEAIKLTNPTIKMYQASSSEMYGKVPQLPITETMPLHPLSPYAVSKAAAHWMAVNYRESFGLFVGTGILFNHESYLRSKNFFVKKIIYESIQIHQGKQDFLRVGNIDIKRDFGFSPDYVEAMWKILQHPVADDFIICSGTSITLREIIEYVFSALSIDPGRIIEDPAFYRPNDIEDIYGDSSKAKQLLGWENKRPFFTVLDSLIAEEMAAQGLQQ